MATESLYETDFYSWTQEQARLLRVGNMSMLDMDNILEEIEAMGRSEKRNLVSRLSLLLAHLIKWQYQPEKKGKSWRLTIAHQRIAINDLLKDSPGLKSMLGEKTTDAWRNAVREAEAETGISRKRFPKECPWSFEEFMDEAFWPDPEAVP